MQAPPMTVRPGGHVCGVAATAAERSRMAAAWVRAGLDAGERVLWIEAPGGPVLDWLEARAIPWREALATGQLVVASADDLLALRSTADIPGRIALVTAFAEQALAAGYPALRMGADAAVALERMPDVATQVALEAAWEAFTRRRRVSFLCMYDPETYGPDLARAVAGHPRGFADGIAFAILEEGRLRVSGEIDVSNVETFGEFAAAVTTGGDVVVDLEGLSFIDARGTSRLVALSHMLAPSRLRVASAPPVLRRILDITGWSSDLELV